ncbi:MAG TPA: nucleotidyltransferase domain-containing protein [Bacillota bacterium]|nr:nucleotidyltransferase domain-containing protein [Bacillota bacterium]
MMSPFDKIPVSYQADIEKAVKILKNEGCQAVNLFGSLAEGSSTEISDIDLAVKGCPPEKFFHVLGKLIMELDHPVDLIDLDERNDFVLFLEKEGSLMHVQ